MFFWKLRFLWLQSIFAMCFPKFLGRTPTSLGRCKLMESLCLAGEMLCFDPSSSNGPMARSAWLFMAAHSSEIRGLHLTKFTSEILQNLLYFVYYKKTNVDFLFFISCNFTFPLINTLFYVNTDQDIHKGENVELHKIKKEEKLQLHGFTYVYKV